MTLSFIENASAQKVLFMALAFMFVTWIGGKVDGSDVGTADLAWVAAIVVLYALIDHLYAIRRALEARQ